MIEFRKITDDNMDECIDLKVNKGQESFVASNILSLAEAYVYTSTYDCHVSPYAIYVDDIMVGFIKYAYWAKDERLPFGETCYHIWRLMLDKNHQGKGYGKQAVEKVIDEIKTFPHGKANSIYMSYESENAASKKLFHSFGFVDTNKKFTVDDDEIIARFSI